MNFFGKCYLCNQLSYFKKRICFTCNNYACKNCFIADDDSFFTKGFCIRCYRILEKDQNNENQKLSEMELKEAQLTYLDYIEKSPYEFFDKLECIGKGNFSTVYKVRSSFDQKEYALKQLNSGDKFEAFIEFSHSVVTSCDNLLKNVALYYYDNTFYILQELMKCSLRDFICNRKQLPERIILFILREISKGLAFLHHYSKIHRDLKTENVFAGFSGEIKIGDFGSVGQLTQEHEFRTTLIGTPLFLAPELVMGRKYSFEVDIWSLGVIAYELIFKVTPFCNCTNIYELGQYINNFTVESLKHSEYQKVDMFIRSCLLPDPSRRTTAKEILENELYMVNDLECSSFIRKPSVKTAEGRLLTPKTTKLSKERSASHSRLLLTAALLESKSATKSPKGSDIFPKSGSSTPRKLPPIEDLHTYYKQVEDQEEKALALILRELDGLASLHLS